jgi:hypothetical protein
MKDKMFLKIYRKILNASNRVKRDWYLKTVFTDIAQRKEDDWKEANNIEFLNLRQKSLEYIESNHQSEINTGSYSYFQGGPPLLYASCYAALTRFLFGDLDRLSDDERASWVAYIQQFQEDDGLFRDRLVDSTQANELDWWGWRHLTVHALMALDVLEGKAQKPFELLNPFKEPGFMNKWLDSLDWQNDPASWSNKIQNYGTMLQYARDYQGQSWCSSALDEMYTWLDKYQDPQTGYWGYGSLTKQERSLGVQTGYHIWLLYFYDGRPIQYIDRIIDSCLATQNRLGGFGATPNSSACEDIDSIDPLVRLYFFSNYRKKDIYKTLEKTLPWLLVNINNDGGWMFRWGETFHYGHDLMTAQSFQSSMFPTWFRTLSLAYLSKVLMDKPVAELKWKFKRQPGYQFWFVEEK